MHTCRTVQRHLPLWLVWILMQEKESLWQHYSCLPSLTILAWPDTMLCFLGIQKSSAPNCQTKKLPIVWLYSWLPKHHAFVRAASNFVNAPIRSPASNIVTPSVISAAAFNTTGKTSVLSSDCHSNSASQQKRQPLCPFSHYYDTTLTVQ